MLVFRSCVSFHVVGVSLLKLPVISGRQNITVAFCSLFSSPLVLLPFVVVPYSRKHRMQMVTDVHSHHKHEPFIHLRKFLLYKIPQRVLVIEDRIQKNPIELKGMMCIFLSLLFISLTFAELVSRQQIGEQIIVLCSLLQKCVLLFFLHSKLLIPMGKSLWFISMFLESGTLWKYVQHKYISKYSSRKCQRCVQNNPYGTMFTFCKIVRAHSVL